MSVGGIKKSAMFTLVALTFAFFNLVQNHWALFSSSDKKAERTATASQPLPVRERSAVTEEKKGSCASFSCLLEEKIRRVLKSEIAFAAKDFSHDSYNSSILFPNVGIMRGGGILDCPALSPNIVKNHRKKNITGDSTQDRDFLVEKKRNVVMIKGVVNSFKRLALLKCYVLTIQRVSLL